MTHYSPFVFSCSAPTPVNDLLSNKIGPRPAAVASAPSTRKQRSIRCWSDLTMPFSLHHPPRPSLILPVPSVPTMKMMMQVPPYSQSLHEHQIEWTTEQSAPARAWSECNSAHQLCLWSTNGGSFLVWWGRCYMIDFLHNFLFFFCDNGTWNVGIVSFECYCRKFFLKHSDLKCDSCEQQFQHQYFVYKVSKSSLTTIDPFFLWCILMLQQNLLVILYVATLVLLHCICYYQMFVL